MNNSVFICQLMLIVEGEEKNLQNLSHLTLVPNVCFPCQMVGLILGTYQVDKCRRQRLGWCTLRGWSVLQVASGHSGPCAAACLLWTSETSEKAAHWAACLSWEVNLVSSPTSWSVLENAQSPYFKHGFPNC